MKKVGIWIRVSTSMQAQGDSPEHHEKRARALALAKDWEVAEVYHLEAVSGKSVIDHSEARRMLADIRSGHIQGLIFSKIARLARNTKELLEFAELFEENNAGLISIEESIDTSTPSGRFFYTLLSAMAQWEREEIAERVASSIPIRAKMGKSLGGQAPFGYEWNEDKKLVLNEEEANIRRHMYDLFLKHKRKRTVARMLNEQGYTARKGKWSDNTVSRLLEDSIGYGMRRINYTQARKGYKEIKDEKHWEYVEVPALITKEKWDSIQAILQEQANSYVQPLKTNLHLFTGIAQCSCGTNMYVLSKTMKYVCQSCKRKITCDDLEAIFQDQLHSFSISEDSLQDVLQQNNKFQQSQERLLETTNRDIKKVEKEINSLFTLHENGQLETDDFSRRYNEPKQRLENLLEQRENIKRELENNLSKQSFQSKIFSTLKDVYGNWNNLEDSDKRLIIESMTERIIIDEESIEITLKQLNPSFSENVTFGRHNHTDSWQQLIRNWLGNRW